MVAAGVGLGLGQAGALEGVDQGEAAVEQLGARTGVVGASAVTARSMSSLRPAISSLNNAAEASSDLATSASPWTRPTTARASARWAARCCGCSAVSASRGGSRRGRGR